MRANVVITLAALGFVAGCSSPEPTQSLPESVSTSETTLVAGDVFPTSLRATELVAKAPDAVLHGSDPLPVKTVYEPAVAAPRFTSRDFRIVLPEGVKAQPSIPIDAPDGARVVITMRHAPMVGPILAGIHLRDATGKVMDAARDPGAIPAATIDELDPLPKDDADANPHVTSRRPTGLRVGLADVKPIEAKPLPLEEIEKVLREDPTMAPFMMPMRVVSIDVKAAPGRMMLEIPGTLGKNAFMLDVQQPNSKIFLGATPRTQILAFGEEQEIIFDMVDGDAPLDGATFEAVLQAPSGARYDDLKVVPAGNGKYVARIPLVSADPKFIGTWSIQAKAKGRTAAGVEFERDATTHFSYTVPYARMNRVHQPRVVTGADGLVDEIVFDVDVESVQASRLGLGAGLVIKGEDGQEHPVATAQTGQDVPAGTTVMSLRFSAQSLAIAKKDGPFYLRDLNLTSANNVTTLHRLGGGVDKIQTPPLRAASLRFDPAKVPSSVQESIDLGSL